MEWRGHKVYVDSHGYPRISLPDHPLAEANGFVKIHRLVMSETLGRNLAPEEHVHHIDENKMNFEATNLKMLSASQHSKMHARPKTVLNLICKFCGKEFPRNLGQEADKKGYKNTYCTKSCAASGAWEDKTGGDLSHGKRVTYTYHKCRCALCKESQRVYMSNRRKPAAVVQSG